MSDRNEYRYPFFFLPTPWSFCFFCLMSMDDNGWALALCKFVSCSIFGGLGTRPTLGVLRLYLDIIWATAVSILMVNGTPTSYYLFYLLASCLEYLDGWMNWDLWQGCCVSLLDIEVRTSHWGIGSSQFPPLRLSRSIKSYANASDTFFCSLFFAAVFKPPFGTFLLSFTTCLSTSLCWRRKE